MSDIPVNTAIVEAVAATPNVPTKRARRSKEEVAANKKDIATKKNHREIAKKLVLFEKQKRALDKDMLLLEKKKRKLSDTENALKNLKSAPVEAEQPKTEQHETEQPEAEQPRVINTNDTESENNWSQSEDESDEESDPEEEQAKRMKDYLANKVDIFSEESIRKKIPDIPTCACGGHSVCLGCKTKWNITLTQKHRHPFNTPAPGEEFICIREFDMDAEVNCFSDVVGTLPCVLCLEHGSEGSNNNNARLSHVFPEMIPMLIGEHARCPGCLSFVESMTKCGLCSYPVKFMNK